MSEYTPDESQGGVSMSGENVMRSMTPEMLLDHMRKRPWMYRGSKQLELVRLARGEGFDAGERDAMDPRIETHTCTPNPYSGGGEA